MCSNVCSSSPGDMVLFAFSLARLNNNLKSEQVIHIKILILNTLHTFKVSGPVRKRNALLGRQVKIENNFFKTRAKVSDLNSRKALFVYIRYNASIRKKIISERNDSGLP